MAFASGNASSTVPWDPSGAKPCLRAARSAVGFERRRQANQPESNLERQIPGIKSLERPASIRIQKNNTAATDKPKEPRATIDTRALRFRGLRRGSATTA